MEETGGITESRKPGYYWVKLKDDSNKEWQIADNLESTYVKSIGKEFAKFLNTEQGMKYTKWFFSEDEDGKIIHQKAIGSFKSALREEIEKEKKRSLNQTTRSNFDLGYEAALDEVLKNLDTINP